MTKKRNVCNGACQVAEKHGLPASAEMYAAAILACDAPVRPPPSPPLVLLGHTASFTPY